MTDDTQDHYPTIVNSEDGGWTSSCGCSLHNTPFPHRVSCGEHAPQMTALLRQSGVSVRGHCPKHKFRWIRNCADTVYLCPGCSPEEWARTRPMQLREVCEGKTLKSAGVPAIRYDVTTREYDVIAIDAPYTTNSCNQLVDVNTAMGNLNDQLLGKETLDPEPPKAAVQEIDRASLKAALISGLRLHDTECKCQHCDACQAGSWDEAEADRWLARRGEDHKAFGYGLWALTSGKRTLRDKEFRVTWVLKKGLMTVDIANMLNIDMGTKVPHGPLT